MTTPTIERTSDVGSVLPALTAAFWSYPETVHLLPSERVRRRVLPRYLWADAAASARFGTLFRARLGDVVVGAAAWVPPDGYPTSLAEELRQARHLLPVAPWGISALGEARRGQAANRAAHRSRPPHHWLRVLGIAPEQQGRGIGTSLVQVGLDAADRDGVGCFLFTASEANASWYRRFGFVPGDSYRPTPGWPPVWALWRAPTVSPGPPRSA